MEVSPLADDTVVAICPHRPAEFARQPWRKAFADEGLTACRPRSERSPQVGPGKQAARRRPSIGVALFALSSACVPAQARGTGFARSSRRVKGETSLSGVSGTSARVRHRGGCSVISVEGGADMRGDKVGQGRATRVRRAPRGVGEGQVMVADQQQRRCLFREVIGEQAFLRRRRSARRANTSGCASERSVLQLQVQRRTSSA